MLAVVVLTSRATNRYNCRSKEIRRCGAGVAPGSAGRNLARADLRQKDASFTFGSNFTLLVPKRNAFHEAERSQTCATLRVEHPGTTQEIPLLALGHSVLRKTRPPKETQLPRLHSTMRHIQMSTIQGIMSRTLVDQSVPKKGGERDASWNKLLHLILHFNFSEALGAVLMLFRFQAGSASAIKVPVCCYL